MYENQIIAKKRTIDPDVQIGAGTIIKATEIDLKKGTRIGSNVEIVCDKFVSNGGKIESGCQIMCPEIVLEEGSAIGRSGEIMFNEYFHLGRYSNIAKGVVMCGQGFKAGEFLWMGERVVIGGGGSKGPRAYLTIGDQASVFDDCYINLSEAVDIGKGTALSSGVNLLTHAAWQPALMGYSTKFAPIKIGDHVVVYLKSVVLPGVTIGDYSTVGAQSLVHKDVPAHCLAAGTPAEIRKGPEDYPRPLSSDKKNGLIDEILRDYLTTLKQKGVEVLSNKLKESGEFVLQFRSEEVSVRFLSEGATAKNDAEITLSFSPAGATTGRCHFDLSSLKMVGVSSPIAEDLRDYLRRRAIRIFNGAPFRTLPLVNFDRLRKIKEEMFQS